MTIGATVLTVLASASAGIVASLITVRTAKIAALPNSERALTERFTALTDRMDREREHLEKKISKLEANLADLEVRVIRDMAWGDEVAILMDRRQIPYPPRPHF